MKPKTVMTSENENEKAAGISTALGRVSPSETRIFEMGGGHGRPVDVTSVNYAEMRG